MAEETKKTTPEVEANAATAAVQAPKAEPNPAQENPEKFLKEFNWEKYEEGIEVVDDKQLEEFENLVAQNFVDTLDDNVVEGKVINITAVSYTHLTLPTKA